MLQRLLRPWRMFRNLRNPHTYLAYKWGLLRRDPLFFELRHRVRAEVPRRMMHTFKESVFSEDYVRDIPAAVLARLEKATVVDVGANVGYFSLWFLSRYPEARVIAVEPMPNNFALLSRHAAMNPQRRFDLLNCALAAHDGTVTMHFDRHDAFTTGASAVSHGGGEDPLEVRTLTLASVLERCDCPSIDFLKLDCEGSEYEVLYGCGDRILEKIGCLSMETHAGSSPRQRKEPLCEFLRAKRFTVSTRPGSDMVQAYR